MAATPMRAPALPRSAAGSFNPWIIAIVVSIATFMEVLDTSIANVSLRQIAGGLGADIDEAKWVLTGYLVANAVIVPISGWLASVIGRKRFYMICVALFTISSLLCGMAPNLGLLIFFRILQGIGGGGLAPVEQSILADTFPPDKLGAVFALYGVAVVVAPAIGPTLGGWITDNYSWHWIFLLNVPVGIASLVLSGTMVSDTQVMEKERKEKLRGGLRVDYIGFALVAIGLGALELFVDGGERNDWFGSRFITIAAITAGLALFALVVHELYTDDPIVDIALLKDKSFAAACAVMFSVGFMLYGTTTILPQFMQELLGYTATSAGKALSLGAVATLFMMPVAGLSLKYIQPKYVLAVGLVIEAASMYWMSLFSLDVDFTTMTLARCLQGAGISLLFVPITTVAYAGLPPGKNNNASALINVMRNVGGSVGIAMTSTWLAQRSQFHQNRLVDSLSPGSSAYESYLSTMREAFRGGGAGVVQSGQRAYMSLYQTLYRHARMLSYVDVFWVMMIIAFAMVPLVMILRRTKGEVSMGH